jgi:hypothetical protein
VEQRHPPGGSGAPFAIRPGIEGGAAQVGEHEDPKRDQSEPDRPYTAPACWDGLLEHPTTMKITIYGSRVRSSGLRSVRRIPPTFDRISLGL